MSCHFCRCRLLCVWAASALRTGVRLNTCTLTVTNQRGQSSDTRCGRHARPQEHNVQDVSQQRKKTWAQKSNFLQLRVIFLKSLRKHYVEIWNSALNISQVCLLFFCLRLLLCDELSIPEIIGSRWSQGKKTNIREQPGEWAKGRKERSTRELRSCVSRQTVEMNRRCLLTEDEPSLTAGWGSDLCQCVDDLLQCYNMLETRRAKEEKDEF